MYVYIYDVYTYAHMYLVLRYIHIHNVHVYISMLRCTLDLPAETPEKKEFILSVDRR